MNHGLLQRLTRRVRQLKAETLALYFAARHPLTPWAARLLVAVAVGYALSPIDLIPDFIPVLGLLDELVLLPILLWLALRMIPPGVMADCRERARDLATRPVSRLGGIMIFMIWLGAAWILGTWAYDLLYPTNFRPAP